MINICFLFFVIFTFSTAHCSTSHLAYHDSVCGQYKCTFAEMKQLSSKMLVLGNYICVRNIQYLGPLGYETYHVSDTGTLKISYKSDIGSVRTKFTYGSDVYKFDEYCDGQGSVCGTDNDLNYVQSIDQNQEPIGSIFTSTGYYKKNKNKELHTIESFNPTHTGCILIRSKLTSDHHLKKVEYHDCTKI